MDFSSTLRQSIRSNYGLVWVLLIKKRKFLERMFIGYNVIFLFTDYKKRKKIVCVS